MILACQQISKAFGTHQVLDQVSFHIEENEKATLVGVNGAGKTTLLKIIMEEMSADEGEIILSKGKTIGYLAQHQDTHSQNTIYEEVLEVKREIISMEEKIRRLEKEMKHVTGDALTAMMEEYSSLTHRFELADGYAWKSEITGVLKGLGFSEEEFNKRIHTLSGGQKTRVFLGKLLLSRPDIILLDEPTNHLDMDSIHWLENFLSNYKGSVLVVSHDRYFLDKIVTKVIDLEHGQAVTYRGNYTDYTAKKEALTEARIREYENQQREIKHQEDVITKLRSFNREKSIKRAESREKLLNKIEIVEKPITWQPKMKIRFEPSTISGNDVLTIDNLSKAFGSQLLFHELHLKIKRGEKVALIGKNGTGKTTILKIINKYLAADTGKIQLGAKVRIGYYDQEQQVLHENKTIFDEISDSYPNLTHTRIRSLLAAFLFTGDDVFKPIHSLSGGEKGRVSLAKLMLSNANFLILDEPTNHLDLYSKEILEDAIRHYEGTVFYVSHDRYFINKTATRILDLTENGLVNYKGNYDYYLEKKEEGLIVPDSGSITSETSDHPNGTSDSKEDWKKKKEAQAKARKRANDLKKCESQITALEEELEQLDATMALPENAANPAKLLEITNRQAQITDELETLYEQWEELAGEE
ncbi:MAG: ABC-F family ATP-binding cassette domain-containing protein [Lachnospiraceae bacterium]|nr:ABC-F family ATP-binding cassette domain-containing protein [Lachnospiraceae bacterium]